MIRKRISILVAMLSFAAGTLCAQTNPTVAADPMSEVISVLQKHSLSFELRPAEKAAIQALIVEADPFGMYLDAAEAAAFTAKEDGTVYDVGLVAEASEEGGGLAIAAVREGSPAAEAGLVPGDRIEELDRGDVSEFGAAELSELLRGPADETVLLKVRSTNDVAQERELGRAAIQLEAIAAAEELPTGIGYLKLNGLYGHSGKDIISTLRGWMDALRPGIVIDLRGASGTALDVVGDVASLFKDPESLLFRYTDAQDSELMVCGARPGVKVDIPAMVLVDGDTRGAAEVLSAVLSDGTRGVVLIGSTTRGDPLVREMVPLSDGQMLYVVTKRLITADGSVYDGRLGVTPDITVDRQIAPLYEAELPPDGKKEPSREELEDRALRQRVRGDAPLARAVDLLLGLEALNSGD